MTAVAFENAVTEGSGELRMIPLSELHESPKNPRTHYDPTALKQLADNLKTVGQITPVLVRPRPNGKGGYELAAGHRRARAAKLAGLTVLNTYLSDLRKAGLVEEEGKTVGASEYLMNPTAVVSR